MRASSEDLLLAVLIWEEDTGLLQYAFSVISLWQGGGSVSLLLCSAMVGLALVPRLRLTGCGPGVTLPWIRERTVPAHSCRLSGAGESSRLSSGSSSEAPALSPQPARGCSSCGALLVTVSAEINPPRLSRAGCCCPHPTGMSPSRCTPRACVAVDRWMAGGLEIGIGLCGLESRWSLGWEEAGEEER